MPWSLKLTALVSALNSTESTSPSRKLRSMVQKLPANAVCGVISLPFNVTFVPALQPGILNVNGILALRERENSKSILSPNG